MKMQSNFKIRASASCQITTNPTGKSNLEKYNDAIDKLLSLELQYETFKNKECKSAIEILSEKIPVTKKLISELETIKDKVELSQTTITYVHNYIKEQIYGVRKSIKSKYLDKGLKLEDTAIDKAIEWLDLSFAIKNEQYFEDEFFCGTPDLIVDGVVYDTKCSWDCFTFPLFEDEIPNKDYFYQLQVYMHLTGLKKACLVYVLLNTPDDLPQWEDKHNYDNMDKKYRIKKYDIEYSEEVIQDLQNRVINVREYIKTIEL